MMLPNQQYGSGAFKNAMTDMMMGAGGALSNHMMMMLASSGAGGPDSKNVDFKSNDAEGPDAQDAQFDERNSSSSSDDDSDVDDLAVVDYTHIEFADLKVSVKPVGEIESATDCGGLFNEMFNSSKNRNVGELLLSSVSLEEDYIGDESIKSSACTHQNGYLKQWDLLEEFGNSSNRQNKKDKFFMFNYMYSQRVVSDEACMWNLNEKRENQCDLLEEDCDTLTSLSKEFRIKSRIEKNFSHVAIKNDNEKFNQFNSLINTSNSNVCLKNCLSLLGSENLLMA